MVRRFADYEDQAEETVDGTASFPQRLHADGLVSNKEHEYLVWKQQCEAGAPGANLSSDACVTDSTVVGEERRAESEKVG